MRMVQAILCSLFLSGAMAIAQKPDTPTQPPPLSTPPTFPQGQAQPPAETMPPDTRAPAPQNAPVQSSSTSTSQTTIEGCLGGTAGNYVLTDTDGATMQLHGDASQLAKHVGKQVRISGTPMSKSGELGDRDSKAETANTLIVNSVNTIAETCTPTQPQSR